MGRFVGQRRSVGPWLLGLAWALTVGVLAAPVAPAAAQGTPAAEETAPAEGVVATEGEALLRVVHASPDAPAIDVWVDDAVAVEGLAFGAASDFLSVAAGERRVRVVPAGSDPEDGAVLEEEVDLEEGSASVFAATGLLAEIEARVYEVDLGAFEEEGRARVRVVHAAPDAPEVTVAVKAGETLFEGVGFGDASDYAELEEGTYDLEVRAGDEEAVVLEAPDVAFAAGLVYDLFAIGRTEDTSLRLLPVAAEARVPCAGLVGVGTATDACVRVVHASTGAPAVDVYVGETAVAENIAFGSATEYLNLPGGEHQVRIVPTGEPPDDAVIELTEEFDEGRPYLIVAAGSLEEIEADVHEIDLGPLAAESARVRVVHAAADAGEVAVAIAGGPVLFEGVEFREATEYAVLAAGSYDLEARSTESEELAVDVQGLVLEGGTVYDVVALGSVEEGTAQMLPLATTAVAEDAEVMGTPAAGSEPTPVGTPEP